MTAEENNKLFLQLKEYDKSSQEYKEIRDKIYNGNIGLVYKAAKELNILKSNKYDYEDAIQTGKMGLFISIEKFDVDLGNTFSTFAFHYAKGYILDWLNRDLEHGAKLISYDKKLEWEESKSQKDYLSFKDESLEKTRRTAIDLQKLSGFLKQLNENQRKVIQLRYLSGGEIKTFEQISKELGITRQGASYMEISAIKRIKDLWQGKGETRQGKFALIQQYVIKNKKYLKCLSPEMATILSGTYIENNYLSAAKISAKLGMKQPSYVTLRDRALKDLKKVVTAHENGTYNSVQKYLTAHKTQLEMLSKIEQQVLELKYLDGNKKNRSEIAECLGITPPAVSDIGQRAFKKLIQLVHESKTKNQQETQ